MHLIQSLPQGALDIVGDIHGEYDALCELLRHMGYGPDGSHRDGRKLVFVGDFCDRGPDSPAVIALVQRLVDAGRAVAILGNHELNLLRNNPTDGSGWFFDARHERDQFKYAPFVSSDGPERERIRSFLATLPIALERADLRIVHAAWIEDSIELVRKLPCTELLPSFDAWEQGAEAQALASHLHQRMADEQANWPHSLEDRAIEPPLMPALAEHSVIKQMGNPLKILTSGVECMGAVPFYSSGRWRFANRIAWWDTYDEPVPVVIGHYWRRVNEIDRMSIGKGDPDLFEGTPPTAWHGKLGNVFCVDFSVGGRWQERQSGASLGGDFKLAAMRWPERVLMFDDGSAEAGGAYSQLE